MKIGEQTKKIFGTFIIVLKKVRLRRVAKKQVQAGLPPASPCPSVGAVVVTPPTGTSPNVSAGLKTGWGTGIGVLFGKFVLSLKSIKMPARKKTVKKKTTRKKKITPLVPPPPAPLPPPPPLPSNPPASNPPASNPPVVVNSGRSYTGLLLVLLIVVIAVSVYIIHNDLRQVAKSGVISSNPAPVSTLNSTSAPATVSTPTPTPVPNLAPVSAPTPNSTLNQTPNQNSVPTPNQTPTSNQTQRATAPELLAGEFKAAAYRISDGGFVGLYPGESIIDTAGGPLSRTGNVSVTWTGNFYVVSAGQYEFNSGNNTGDLYIDGKRITSSTYLGSGTHKLVFGPCLKSAGALISLMWQKIG